HLLAESGDRVAVGRTNPNFEHVPVLPLDSQTIVLESCDHPLEVRRVGSVAVGHILESGGDARLSGKVDQLLKHDPTDRPVVSLTLDPIHNRHDRHPLRWDQQLPTWFRGITAGTELELVAWIEGFTGRGVELNGDA